MLSEGWSSKPGSYICLYEIQDFGIIICLYVKQDFGIIIETLCQFVGML